MVELLEDITAKCNLRIDNEVLSTFVQDSLKGSPFEGMLEYKPLNKNKWE